MGGPSSPINIATPSRNGSLSPRNQPTSNLTTALQSTTGNEIRPLPNTNSTMNGGKWSGWAGRRESGSNSTSAAGSQWSGEAQPISMESSSRQAPRRESVAKSLVDGMSWGGVSVSSFVRDDIIMQGTSPFAYQSPSYHSSSYLPKMEANFMKDFRCCGKVLGSMHELLQHFELCHHDQQTLTTLNQPHSDQSSVPPASKVPPPPGAAASAQHQTQQQRQSTGQNNLSSESNSGSSQPFLNAQNMGGSSQQRLNNGLGEFSRPSLQNNQDIDDVEDMEMDDIIGDTSSDIPLPQSQYSGRANTQMPRPQQFGASRVPPLDLNALNFGNPLQAHQGLRQSQPTTPVSAGRSSGLYQNNPTVSSVNTPTLTAHPVQKRQFPDSPGPSALDGALEFDNGFIGGMGGMSMDTSQPSTQQQQMGYKGYGLDNENGNDMLGLYIDDPAKRLYTQDGGATQPYAHFRLGNAQYGPNSEIARRIREQQMKAGLSDTTSGLHGEEPKPFRCPVIGCEKAYKNQNGLKYHKSHGHNNQQLHENDDGTFSIVDPTTSTPYPGTLGMEKEKPYKCDVCGKRYKNLNGLKYHRSHSSPCNPELKFGGGPMNSQAFKTTFSESGLPGIGEEAAL